MLLEKFALKVLRKKFAENRNWNSLRKKSYRNECRICLREMENGKETELETENVCGYVA